MQKHQEEMVVELKKLVKSMDVPEFRKKNVKWLRNNLHIKNEEHPNYTKVIELCDQLLSEGVAKF